MTSKSLAELHHVKRTAVRTGCVYAVRESTFLPIFYCPTFDYWEEDTAFCRLSSCNGLYEAACYAVQRPRIRKPFNQLCLALHHQPSARE